jgi:hypothetical protein
MQRNERGKSTRSELASLTVSMLLSMIYFMTVCWVMPVVPMVIVWVFDMSFTSFMALWFSGLPFFSLSWYYLLKTKKK